MEYMEAEARSEIDRIRPVKWAGSEPKTESMEVEAHSEVDRRSPVQGAGSKSKNKWIKSLFARGKSPAK
jgi:hypothetical protein